MVVKNSTVFLRHTGFEMLHPRKLCNSLPPRYMPKYSPKERVSRGDLERAFNLCDELPNTITFNESHQCSAGIAGINK